MNASRGAVLCLCSLAACGSVAGSGTDILAPRVSEGQEVRVGQRAAREVARTLGLVADQALQDYVQQIGARLAAGTDRAQLPWTFRVADDPMPNAFALPGGFVFVTRGILSVVNSEAELAALLAHEIAHVTARHGVQALARRSGPQIGIWAVPVPELRSLDGASGMGAGLLWSEYGPDAERQADELGFKYVLAAGYDVRDIADLFSILGRLDPFGARSALPSWATTHPDPGDRVEAAAHRAESVNASGDSFRQNRSPYLDQIEDLVYGRDPREGFFRSSTFFHPQLRFRLELPSGWQHRSLAEAVVSTSPNRDAAIQLTVVDQPSPTEAAERFLAQSGIGATGDRSTDTVHGNSAVFVPFRASSGAHTAEGLAAWVAYGGRIYQIVGVTESQTGNGYPEEFRESFRSFAPVTDAQFLDVRPNRINIVRLGRTTTFEDFNRRYPSAVDVDEIALLNRVAGGASRLPAGGRVKRVVRG